jgi:hypothetical protein
VEFRTWLDGARLLLLLICHIGVAASFVVWNPTIPCPDDSESPPHCDSILSLRSIQAPDDRRVCQLLNVYIIIASWVPPLLRECGCFELKVRFLTSIVYLQSFYTGLVLPCTPGTTPVNLGGHYQQLKNREAYSPVCGVVLSPSRWCLPRRVICRISRIHCRRALTPVGVIRVESLDERAG